MKKRIFVLLGLLVAMVIGYYIYAFIITVGNQRLETIPISKELKELERQVRVETKSGDYTRFIGYAQYEVDNCNAQFKIKLSIDNDSIIEKGIDEYVDSVNKRVNEKLINKKCIDSLIIKVSSYYSREKVDSLKSKHYRYSFPVK